MQAGAEPKPRSERVRRPTSYYVYVRNDSELTLDDVRAWLEARLPEGVVVG